MQEMFFRALGPQHQRTHNILKPKIDIKIGSQPFFPLQQTTLYFVHFPLYKRNQKESNTSELDPTMKRKRDTSFVRVGVPQLMSPDVYFSSTFAPVLHMA